MVKQRIPAGRGTAFRLVTGQVVRVSCPEAEQVADLVAFADPDIREYLSSGRTLDYASSTKIGVGTPLYSNRSRVMLKLVADTVGVHDFMLTPCSKEMFSILHRVDKRGCLENLADGLKPFGVEPDCIPVALNLFMRVAIDGETGDFEIGPPGSEAGDHVDLRAEMDLFIGVSACSSEWTNSGSLKPIDIEILD